MKLKKMNPEVKAMWLSELRSGDYLQGVGCLKSAPDSNGKCKHCCLGVLCEIYDRVHGQSNFEPYRPYIEEPYSPYDDPEEYTHHQHLSGATGFLPDEVAEWAEMDTDTREGGFTLQDELARMNDYKKPFSVIADWIEKNL